MCETARKQSGLCVIVATSAIYVLIIRCWYVTVVRQVILSYLAVLCYHKVPDVVLMLLQFTAYY